tara:strand:- start:131 stop:430 length:300 start_codon:yes stop_codon:yes gene_type:complete
MPLAFSVKNPKGLKAGLRSLTEVFKSIFKTLFSLINAESTVLKFIEVAIAAIPVKNKMDMRPKAIKVPNSDAKKLLKKFISAFLKAKIGFVKLFYEIYN